MSWRYVSALENAPWPAIPDAAGSGVLALLFQLDRAQWLPVEQLAQLQAKQLDLLLRHAYETVPFYRDRWGALPGAAHLGALPVLRRRELQERFAELQSSAVPREHGAVQETRTSGSTGTPVRVTKTALEGLFWRAITLRDHSWHRRTMQSALAVIRRGAGRGSSASWGAATERLVETGPCLSLDVDVDSRAQLEWLQRHGPAYLLTYPSLAAELARLSIERAIASPGLREVRTLGEALDPDVRQLCRDAWSVPVVDMYSAEETGYIALQCPDRERYHVQSESVLVEVLDDAGKACGPGQVGRVVVTTLHNFATPLIRYDIGDYAEVGSACACGRGLPVLNRILGRTRNMLVTASGERFWPSLGVRRMHDVASVRQCQFVQRSLDTVEARLVVDRPLDEEQANALRQRIASRLPPGFRVNLSYCSEIARSASGKFEEFVSAVSDVPR